MLPPVPSVGISVNIYPFWLPPNSILLRSGPCEFLLEWHPWISRLETCSRGEPHICDGHVAPEWSVKFPIASPCTWSLSVSSNSCLKTLIILNFPQSVWKLLQENSELENFPEIFSHCFDPPRRKQPMDSLVTLDSPDLFHALLQCRVLCFLFLFFENNEFQRSLFSQLWQRQTPLLPQPMTSSSAPLSFWYTDHGISRINGPRLLCSLMLREWWCEATAPLPSEMSWEGFSLIFSNKEEKTPYSVKF